ncbi:hypothetical protein Tco_0336747 [Tanacetum coccineum]
MLPLRSLPGSFPAVSLKNNVPQIVVSVHNPIFHLHCPSSVVAIEKTGSDVVGMENEESGCDGLVNVELEK